MFLSRGSKILEVIRLPPQRIQERLLLRHPDRELRLADRCDHALLYRLGIVEVLEQLLGRGLAAIGIHKLQQPRHPAGAQIVQRVGVVQKWT